MKAIFQDSLAVVAAVALFTGTSMLSVKVFAQDTAPQVRVESSTKEILNELFVELMDPGLEDWSAVEQKIWAEWRKSGSDAMDLLLERGRTAMAAGDLPRAVEHLTALTDHAPEFAEGWNTRATAFFMMDEYGLSVSDIQSTLALNPRHFGAMSGLGLILEETGQLENALRTFQAALAVHPHRPDLIEAVERLKEKTDGTSL